MSREDLSAGACAVHPAVRAIVTCSRCGNFVCSACQSLSRADLCDACEAIVGSFPLTRDGFDVSQALGYAWRRYQAEWVLPTMLTLAYFGVNYVLALSANLLSVRFASPDTTLPGLIAATSVRLVSAVLKGVLLAGIIRVAVVALHDQTPTVAHVAQGMRRSGALVVLQCAYVVFGSVLGLPLVALESGTVSSEAAVLCSALGGLVLLLPAVLYVGLGVQNMGVEPLVDPDVGVVDALKRSWTVADGARGELFVAGLVSGLVMLGGILACGVGLIPALGVAIYLTTATYLALRTTLVPAQARER